MVAESKPTRDNLSNVRRETNRNFRKKKKKKKKYLKGKMNAQKVTNCN
jgi:hypothetical protein